MQLYSGIDLSPFRDDLISEGIACKNSPKQLAAIWKHTWMGLKTSPLQSVQYYYYAEEFARGNHREVNNPLRWDKVIFNLPGNDNFKPALPNVIKWNSQQNKLAGEVKSYVDDLRAIGWSTEHAWQIARRVVSRL